MKVKEVVNAYSSLNSAKMTKMEDGSKFKVIKALRSVKKVNSEYDDFLKDAQEKLKGDEFEEMKEKAQKWQEDGDKTNLSLNERLEINKFFTKYNESVSKCMKEEDEKEVDLDYEKLTEDEFKLFVASNDFDVQTMAIMQDVLMD